MGEVMEAVEVGDVMEAAQTTDSVEATAEVADTVETAVGVADAVEAAMEGVTAAMSAGMTAAVPPARRRDGRRESCRDDVRVAASAVFRSMDLSPLQAVHPWQYYRCRLTRR
jgi:MoxR-like ATPase